MKFPPRAILLAFVCLFVASDEIGAGSDACVDDILLTVPSPDGAWLADIDLSICDLGLSSAATNEVRLFSTDDSAGPTPVLGLDAHGAPGELPRLAWTAPDHLQVTVPNVASLGAVTRRVGPIQVEVVFDPPDPAARAALRRKLDLPPEDAPN